MTVRPNQPLADMNVTAYFGLTLKQFANLPGYVRDGMVSALREVKSLQRKLDISEGIKPQPWRESHRAVGAQVETLDGTYVFPFEPEVRSRATVGLCLPSGAKVQLIHRHSEPDEVEVYCEGTIALHPTAANTFRLTINRF